jgi:hypothetical protein
VPLANRACDVVDAIDAVLQREHTRLGSYERRQHRQRARIVVRLHGVENDVDRSDPLRIVLRGRVHGEVTKPRTAHFQAAAPNGIQMRASRNKRDVLPALREPGPEVAPNRTGSQNGEFHIDLGW